MEPISPLLERTAAILADCRRLLLEIEASIAPSGPTVGVPAAFAVKSILAEDGKPVGILAVQIPDPALQKAIDSESGLGKTGEVVLLGPNRTTRSASRFEGGFGLLDRLPC